MAQHETLATALAAFQAELPKIRKDETAKVTGEGKNGRVSYTYGYAGLDAVVEAVLPALGKHGLSITSKTTYENGEFLLLVSLLHTSGEREVAVWPLPDPRRVGPQDLGSAKTYGRRYLTLALTGTFPGGEDDDGAKAQQSARDSWEEARPADQATQAAPPPKTSWTDEEVLALVKPMPTAEIGKAVQVYDWMAGKSLHRRAVQMDYEGNPVKVTATELIAGRIADEAMAETTTLDAIKQLQAIASGRGLMKVQVSDTETLAEALLTAQELAQHALAAAAVATQESSSLTDGAR